MRTTTAMRRYRISKTFVNKLKRMGKCKGERNSIDDADIEAYFANQRVDRRKPITSSE